MTAPFSDPIMQRAFLELTLIGICSGALGCWVIFYGLPYASESLAHGLFPGLVAAALLGLPLVLGAAAGIVVAALAVAVASAVPGLGRNVAVAVVVTSLFGLGALLALSPASPPGIQGLLFGDVLAVSDGDLALSGALALVIILALRLAHGRLLAVGFDRSSAASLGASPAVADGVVLTLLAGAILVGVQGLGNLLVVAVLVGPAATARLLASRMLPMMGLSVAIAVLCGAGGLLLSYYAGTAAGASVAAVLVAVYLLAAIGSSRRTPMVAVEESR
jgi:ABC-type Mn2+/Zn2+ transport system permease subunit